MTDLDLLATTPAKRRDCSDKLGRSIQIQGGRGDIYTVSYLDSAPDMAKRVVQSPHHFRRDYAGWETTDTNNAQEFLDQQIKEYEAKLVSAEKRLADFKRTHVGKMPGSQDEFYKQLQSAQSSLKQAKLELSEAQKQREQIAKQRKDDEDSYQMYSATGAPIWFCIGYAHTEPQ